MPVAQLLNSRFPNCYEQFIKINEPIIHSVNRRSHLKHGNLYDRCWILSYIRSRKCYTSEKVKIFRMTKTSIWKLLDLLLKKIKNSNSNFTFSFFFFQTSISNFPNDPKFKFKLLEDIHCLKNQWERISGERYDRILILILKISITFQFFLDFDIEFSKQFNIQYSFSCEVKRAWTKLFFIGR